MAESPPARTGKIPVQEPAQTPVLEREPFPSNKEEVEERKDLRKIYPSNIRKANTEKNNYDKLPVADNGPDDTKVMATEPEKRKRGRPPQIARGGGDDNQGLSKNRNVEETQSRKNPGIREGMH
ncbi:MAG: hypothetical protein M3380_21415, partial [Chloroflexota bacterium]|nr:hypothetical protein [Chloroflexota bacterium]